jgi:hypothetical protein
LAQVVAVNVANPTNPAATWAVLASFGDQYAAAAYQGLTDPSSFFGRSIQASNAVAGVTADQYANEAINNANGYVNLLRVRPETYSRFA